MFLDRGENVVTSFKLTKYDFAAAYLETMYCCFYGRNANMNNSRGRNGYDHCFSGKSVCITHSECVFVPLGIQHAKLMTYIVICGLSGSAILCHIFS